MSLNGLKARYSVGKNPVYNSSPIFTSLTLSELIDWSEHFSLFYSVVFDLLLLFADIVMNVLMELGFAVHCFYLTLFLYFIQFLLFSIFHPCAGHRCLSSFIVLLVSQTLEYSHVITVTININAADCGSLGQIQDETVLVFDPHRVQCWGHETQSVWDLSPGFVSVEDDPVNTWHCFLEGEVFSWLCF